MKLKLGNTLRETQENLIKLLGFEYDTIRCSSIFEQGEADSFSKLTPKEAKEVVMKILQLDKYFHYEKICRDKYSKFFEEGQRIQMTLQAYSDTSNLQKVDWVPIEKNLESELSFKNELEERIRFLDEKVRIRESMEGLVQSYNRILELGECPTCKQTLQSEYKEKLKKDLQDRLTQLSSQVSPQDLGELTKYRNDFQKTLMNIGNLKRQIEEAKETNLKIDKLLGDISQLKTQLTDIKKTLETYKQLIGAFGKNGIPAFVIENVVPEIEQISNELLEQLEIDIRVSLSLQKELKSGGTAETLDINVLTGTTLRSYKNYSGGEKFLIDFVLRIALSILLLRRKGCNNSTLLLDEGMGSLDDLNRDKLIRLINLVKEKYGFRKILVISHIDDIQSAFEKKIVLNKENTITQVRYNYIEEDN